MSNPNRALMFFFYFFVLPAAVIALINMLNYGEKTIITEEQSAPFSTERINKLNKECYKKGAYNIEIFQRFYKPERRVLWVYRCYK
jgi:hypothetical protein